MRTLIDIEEDRIRELDRLARSRKRSRAALIREAVSEYLDKQASTNPDDAFGLWADKAVDGLCHQDRMRGEW
jgi:predicted transcriptional regulator